MTTGYSLQRVDVSRLGINLSFTKSGVVQSSQYFWSWWGGYVAPVTTPYSDDIVTSIVYEEINYFEIWKFSHERNDTTWCAAAITPGTARNGTLCVATEQDARAVADAVATLVVASGVNLDSSPGIWLSVKEQEKHPEEACKVSRVDLEGPPAMAGIHEGDVVRFINGKPCTGSSFYRDINEAKRGGPGGADVHVEVLRKGNTQNLDLHYPNPEVGVAELRQKSAESAPPRSPTQSVGQAPASSGFQLGIRLRAVADSDVVPFALKKAKGIVVVQVVPGSLAEAMKFQADDVILEVNDSEIGDVDFFVQFVRSGAAKKFLVWRKGQAISLIVPQSM